MPYNTRRRTCFGGKTTGFTEPSLAGQSILICDPKAELARDGLSSKNALGQKCFVFDPFAIFDASTARTNLLDALKAECERRDV